MTTVLVEQRAVFVQEQLGHLLLETFQTSEELRAAVSAGWARDIRELTSRTYFRDQITDIVRASLTDPALMPVRNLFLHVKPGNWRLALLDFLLRDPVSGAPPPPGPVGGSVPVMFCYFHEGQSSAQSKALLQRIAPIVRMNQRGVVIREEVEGLLSTFRGAAAAVACALEIQQLLFTSSAQYGRQENVSFGLHLGLVLDDGLTPDDLSADIAKQIAAIGDAGQILVSASIKDASQGSDFGIAADQVAWAFQGDYALRSGGVRDLSEVTNLTLRTPAEPSRHASAMALPASRYLEGRGFSNLTRQTGGGSTILYRATLARAGKTQDVAVKVLFEGLGTDAKLVEEFVARAEQVRNLQANGPAEGIVVIQSVERSVPPYFVMDWVPGRHFTDAFKTADPGSRIKLAIKLAEALKYAHDHEVVHGDLKPSNIIVNGDQPVLLDFGQLDWARMKGGPGTSSRPVGTPMYLAPELAQGGAVTKGSDIYSLGVLLYEAFVGRAPFDKGTPEEIIHAHTTVDPPWPTAINPDVGGDLERVILKAMEKLPASEGGPMGADRRYRSVDELLVDLRLVARGQRVKTRPSVYNNMMQTRARTAVAQIDAWHEAKHITASEFGRLRRAFSSLLGTGLSAVGESRLTHLPIVLVYLAGALLVSGMTAFLARHAAVLGNDTILRIGFGLILPVLLGLLWQACRFGGRHRAAFVLGLLTLTSIPIAVTNTLHEINVHTFAFPEVALLQNQAFFRDPLFEPGQVLALDDGRTVEMGSNMYAGAYDGVCQDKRFDVPESNDAATRQDAADCSYLIAAKAIDFQGPIWIVSEGRYVDLGNNASRDAGNGTCEDPRFIGATNLTSYMADASDCRRLFNGGSISLAPTPRMVVAGQELDAGDDFNLAGVSNADGRCEDTRFYIEDTEAWTDRKKEFHDATDCIAQQSLLQVYDVTFDSGGQVFNLGDDRSATAVDGACDDPRFEGEGAANFLILNDLGHDATDCLARLEDGAVAPVPDRGLPRPNRAYFQSGSTYFDLGESVEPYDDNGRCDDPRFAVGTFSSSSPEAVRKDARDCVYLIKLGFVSTTKLEPDVMVTPPDKASFNPFDAHYLNWQLLIGTLVALCWAEFISLRSRTLTISVVSSLLLLTVCVLLLDLIGLRYLVREVNQRFLGLCLLALSAGVLVYARVAPGTWTPQIKSSTSDGPANFNRHAMPFINVALVMLIVALTLISMDLPKHSVVLGIQDSGYIGVGWFLAASGAVIYLLALWIRRTLFIEGAASYWALMYLGIAYMIGGLLLADYSTSSQKFWPAFPVESGLISLGVPLAFVVVVFGLVQSATLNSKALMAYSLAAASATIWYVELKYFPESNAWSVVLLMTGLAGIALMVTWMVVNRRRQDIDDVAQRLLDAARLDKRSRPAPGSRL